MTRCASFLIAVMLAFRLPARLLADHGHPHPEPRPRPWTDWRPTRKVGDRHPHSEHPLDHYGDHRHDEDHHEHHHYDYPHHRYHDRRIRPYYSWPDPCYLDLAPVVFPGPATILRPAFSDASWRPSELDRQAIVPVGFGPTEKAIRDGLVPRVIEQHRPFSPQIPTDRGTSVEKLEGPDVDLELDK
jgi:hypothetical protein